MTTKELFLSLKSYEDFDKHRGEFKDLPIDDETREHSKKIFPTAYAPKDAIYEVKLDYPDEGWEDIKCDFCTHRHNDNRMGSELTIYCDAFPDGKPWREIPDGEDEECANGIRFEDERGEREHKEIIPNPDSILEKMHWVSPRRDRE